jgi:hypothetical protein
MPVNAPLFPLLPSTLLLPYENSWPPLTVNSPTLLLVTVVLRAMMAAVLPPATRP